MKLNPRVKFVWLSEALLLVACVWFVVMVGYLILHPEERIVEGLSNGLLLFLVLSVISLVSLASAWAWASLFYNGFEYSFGEKEAVIEQGIVGKKKTVVPYDKVKEVRVVRSGVHLIDQIFGISTLRIDVGDKKAGEITIPGVSDAQEVIRVMTSKNQRPALEQAKTGENSPADSSLPGSGSDKKLLFEILEELKAIRKALEAGKEPAKQPKEPVKDFTPMTLDSFEGIFHSSGSEPIEHAEKKHHKHSKEEAPSEVSSRIAELTRMIAEKKKKK